MSITILIINEPYYCIVRHGTPVREVEQPWAYFYTVVRYGQMFIKRYDEPWIQWLFCDRRTTLALGS
jgi:hypothetical protein